MLLDRGQNVGAAEYAAVFQQTGGIGRQNAAHRITVSAHRNVLGHVCTVKAAAGACEAVGIALRRFGKGDCVRFGHNGRFKAAGRTGKGHGIRRAGLCFFKSADADIVFSEGAAVCPCAAGFQERLISAGGETVTVAARIIERRTVNRNFRQPAEQNSIPFSGVKRHLAFQPDHGFSAAVSALGIDALAHCRVRRCRKAGINRKRVIIQRGAERNCAQTDFAARGKDVCRIGGTFGRMAAIAVIKLCENRSVLFGDLIDIHRAVAAVVFI